MNVTEIPAAQPLLVLGAPHSGARLATRHLAHLGVLLGHDGNANGESRFFADLNRYLLRAAHAEWDTPEAVAWTLGDEELAEALADELRERCASIKARGFLGGWKSSLRTRSLTSLEGDWGWSEPRTALVLPLWLRLFPRARVLHVLRNGVDVARDLAALEAGRKLELKSPVRSARCLDARRAFDVWAAYVQAGLDHAGALAPERVRHVRYEDLTEDPARVLGDVAEWLGRERDDEAAREALAAEEVPPAYAFRADDAGQDLYRALAGHPLMKRLRYDGLAKQAS